MCHHLLLDLPKVALNGPVGYAKHGRDCRYAHPLLVEFGNAKHPRCPKTTGVLVVLRYSGRRCGGSLGNVMTPAYSSRS